MFIFRENIIIQRFILSLVISIVIIEAQKNLAPGGNASQSTTHLNHYAEKALQGPASTDWSTGCSHTGTWYDWAWWKVEFNSSQYFFNNLKIYYRESEFNHMEGFELYITNQSTVTNPPKGQLCFKDSTPGNPNFFQDIDCYALGRNVVAYNKKWPALIELCYVEANGCLKTKWGKNCTLDCPSNCIDRHCFPENGSCVFGCDSSTCLSDCSSNGVCKPVCKPGGAGQYCGKYNNIALQGEVIQYPVIAHVSSSVIIDGNTQPSSCSILNGSNSRLLIDLQNISVVTALYITFGESANQSTGNHVIYGSNTTESIPSGYTLYNYSTSPMNILVQNGIFRYITYVPPTDGPDSFVQICEIEVIGCHVGSYGPSCVLLCPSNCNGPCHPNTGVCLFGCSGGWIGEYCNHACEDWYYGSNCTETCYCLSNPCNKTTGKCAFGGCKEGYKGEACNEECSGGFFGRTCSQFCYGCVAGLCDRIDGECNNTTTCNSGWKFSSYCNDSCKDFSYGNNCTERCQNCFHGPCNKTTGKCPIGECPPGYNGDSCSEECTRGKFGKGCSQYCHGCISELCDRFNGTCNVTDRCKPGWIYSPYCNTSCGDFYYGENCEGECHECLMPCDTYNGNCTSGCRKGFKGKTCSEDDPITLSLPIIAAIVGAAVVVIIIIVVTVCIRRRRNSDKAHSGNQELGLETLHTDMNGQNRQNMYASNLKIK